MTAKRISVLGLISLVLFLSSTSQADTGTPIATTSSVAQPDRYVQTIIGDGGGGLYIGGSAVLRHINADGSLDRKWKAPGASRGNIYSLARWGNRLYVGGDFERYGGRARSGLAAIDIKTGKLTDWNPSVVAASDPGAGATEDETPSVYSLAVAAGKIYFAGNFDHVGGHFSLVGGQERLGIAALDRKTGSVIKDWHPNLRDIYDKTYSHASGIQVYEGKVYFGGDFHRVGKAHRRNLAAVEAKTGKPTGWAPRPSRPVWTLFRAGRRIYVGGKFSLTDGGRDRENFAAIDARTGAVLP